MSGIRILMSGWRKEGKGSTQTGCQELKWLCIARHNDSHHGSYKIREIHIATGFAGRLHHSARMYGEVFVNGAKSRCVTAHMIAKYLVSLMDLPTFKWKHLIFWRNVVRLQHFSNAGFPCPIMQSPSDHLRAINTDFDRIIAMCKTGRMTMEIFSSVNMDTAVAIRTLEATYKSSANAAAVETMILRLTEREGPLLKSKGKASNATRIAVLTWRSLLTMSREWKYYWLRLILYMLLALCIGTVFSGLGHSLSSVVARVAAIFVFVSFTSLLSIAGVPALLNEIKIYACEESNRHSGALVFYLGNFSPAYHSSFSSPFHQVLS
ncbi:hypothetical protein H0E87_018111, partial [Populus deltoides]